MESLTSSIAPMPLTTRTTPLRYLYTVSAVVARELFKNGWLHYRLANQSRLRYGYASGTKSLAFNMGAVCGEGGVRFSSWRVWLRRATWSGLKQRSSSHASYCKRCVRTSPRLGPPGSCISPTSEFRNLLACKPDIRHHIAQELRLEGMGGPGPV